MFNPFFIYHLTQNTKINRLVYISESAKRLLFILLIHMILLIIFVYKDNLLSLYELIFSNLSK